VAGDESLPMSLSPVELKHQRPRRRLMGYRCDEVDQIMTHATEAYEAVWRDRADLEDRVHELEVKLGELRTTEDAMRDALVTAQRAADEMKAQAGREAELIVREAETRARDIIHKAYGERSKVQRDVERLRAEEQRFRARLRSLLGTTLQTVRDHEELLVVPGEAPRTR
jgi:cell division initiation protein